MSTEQHSLLDWILGSITKHVVQELGGEITFSKDQVKKAIVINWKKYDKETNKTLYFNHKLFYDELLSIKEPTAIAKSIVKKYKKKVKHG